mgnify:CR=1 FL=1|jgi:hypothetical protein
MQVDPRNSLRLTNTNPDPIPTERHTHPDVERSRPDVTAFLPTAALIGLLARLRGIEEVREEIVRQIREHASKGDLVTSAAAAATAHAVLGSDAV